MPANVLADEGAKLVDEEKYAEGIAKLTEALEDHPAPKWLLERSKAYLRTSELELALHDAEHALSVALDRANRDLMVEAQIRRAITFYRLKRYADADVCAFWAVRLCDGAKAFEDDAQQKKLDANGDYDLTSQAVQNEHTEQAASKSNALKAAGAQDPELSKNIRFKNQAFTWRIQALQRMEKLPAGDPGRKVTVVKYPTPSAAPPLKKEPEAIKIAKADDSEEEVTGTEDRMQDSVPAAVSAVGVPTSQTWEDVWKEFNAMYAKSNIRTDFYQTDTSLNISFFVKNVSKEKLKMDASEQSVSLSPVPNVDTITLELFDKIKPAESQCSVKSMKIELVLKKAIPGKWPVLRPEGAGAFDNIAIGRPSSVTYDDFVVSLKELGYTDPGQVSPEAVVHGDVHAWYIRLRKELQDTRKTNWVPTSSTASCPQPLTKSADSAKSFQKTKASDTTATGPAYPTSAKGGPKNWDALNLDDDADGDEKDGDINNFFRKLYQASDDDTRRAMKKSFIESNGTSLSTSWTEAKDKHYETLPPDGAEAKGWDE